MLRSTLSKSFHNYSGGLCSQLTAFKSIYAQNVKFTQQSTSFKNSTWKGFSSYSPPKIPPINETEQAPSLEFATPVDKNAVMVFADEVVMDTGDFIISSSSHDRTGKFPGREPIDMINSIPPIEVKGKTVWCDGGSPSLGHPRVYINLERKRPEICGYCGLRFVQVHDHGHHASSNHSTGSSETHH